MCYYYYYYNTIRPRLPQLATSTGFLIRWRTHSLKISILPNSWIRRFDQWLLLSSFSPVEKMLTQREQLFVLILVPKLSHFYVPKESTYEALKEKLDRQFGVKKLVLAERFRFYSYKQAKTQSLTNYVAELRKLALTCDWNEAQLADNLRDKFVMGLYNCSSCLHMTIRSRWKTCFSTPLHSKLLSKNHSNVLRILIIPQQ